MSENEPRPDAGLRFSLRTLILLVTVSALAIGLIVSLVNNRRLTDRNRMLAIENDRLRDEVGELSIEDEGQLHLIEVATDNELEWAWRVWIPEGRVYHLRVFGGEVPATGFPHGDAGMIMLREAGEQLIRYRIRRDPRNDRWYGSLSAAGATVGKDEQPWVEWNQRTSTTSGVGTSTQAFAPDQRVEVSRHRVSQAGSSEEIEDPAAGFLIWLEPAR